MSYSDSELFCKLQVDYIILVVQASDHEKSIQMFANLDTSHPNGLNLPAKQLFITMLFKITIH
jgi:hypothetical protein